MPEFLAPLDGSGSDDSNGGLPTRDNVVEKIVGESCRCSELTWLEASELLQDGDKVVTTTKWIVGTRQNPKSDLPWV